MFPVKPKVAIPDRLGSPSPFIEEKGWAILDGRVLERAAIDLI
jgi:hypothetical protein